MSLRDRLRKRGPAAGAEQADAPAGADAMPERVAPSADPIVPPTAEFEMPKARTKVEGAAPRAQSFITDGSGVALSSIDQLKVDLHHRLIDRLDLEALEHITDEAELTRQIRDAVVEFLRSEATPLSQAERDEIVEQIVYEITGLGPLEPYVRDTSVSDILVNNARDIYVERRGKLTRVPAQFRNDAHLLAVIDRIVSRVGRRVDESSPMVDARLPDGSRVNAIIPPLALDGPVLSIRRFGAGLAIEALLASGAMSPAMATFLAGCVHAKLNMIISGGTGSGKTTLLNALSAFIPSTERIITIEDAAELRLQQEHVVRLETRPPNVEGRGEVVARDLVRNALRMRPNRVIIGEVRGAEAIDMLQAMNTGHEGSLATIHSNSARDALSRLETMILMSGANLPIKAIREQIASTIDVVVQVDRLTDGTRRVMSITEVIGVEGDIVTTAELFHLERRGIADGRVIGAFRSTGLRPSFADRLHVAGVDFPARIFDEASDVEVGGDAAAPASERNWSQVAESIGRVDADALRAQHQNQTMVRELTDALSAEQREMASLRRHLEVAERQAARAAALEDERNTLARKLEEAERAKTPEPQPPAMPDPAAVGAMLAFIESIDEMAQTATASADQRMRGDADQLRRRADWFAESLGLTDVARVGQRVNDEEHDVVERVQANGVAPGCVTKVVQRGFRLNGRVLRKAQVIATRS